MMRKGRWAALLVAGVFAANVARADEPPAAPAESAQPAAQPDPTPSTSPSPSPAPTPAAAPAPIPDREDVPRPSWKLALGLGVGAGVALLTGIVLGAIAKSRSDEQNGNTADPPLYTPELRSRGSQGEAMATAGYVLLGVGGAIAIADVVLWVERLRPHKKSASQAGVLVRPTATGLRVTF